MSKLKVFIVGAALALLTSGVTLAAASHSATNATKNSTTNAKSTIHHEVGTVNSVDKSDLVLAHSYKGKTQDVTFVLNSNTKKDGTISKGERVRVYFKNDNNKHVATEVKPIETKS
jgi:hypothetical protein